jgi:hypothetical protein
LDHPALCQLGAKASHLASEAQVVSLTRIIEDNGTSEDSARAVHGPWAKQQPIKANGCFWKEINHG